MEKNWAEDEWLKYMVRCPIDFSILLLRERSQYSYEIFRDF
jgi:hypothetical protein